MIDHKATSFRTDINGLRVWAVVAVVLYHFGVPGFGGGFVGVDVFFVNSGFLMTGMVVKGLERATSSVWGFYMARARRIVPALLVLCVVLLALGWLVLLPPDYKTLGSHSVYPKNGNYPVIKNTRSKHSCGFQADFGICGAVPNG